MEKYCERLQAPVCLGQQKNYSVLGVVGSQYLIIMVSMKISAHMLTLAVFCTSQGCKTVDFTFLCPKSWKIEENAVSYFKSNL